MEIGIYISTIMINLVRELYFSSYRQFLAAREVSCCHTLHFSGVLWLLAGDVHRIAV